MRSLLEIIGLILLIAFVMVSCDPKSSGQAVRTFLNEANLGTECR